MQKKKKEKRTVKFLWQIYSDGFLAGSISDGQRKGQELILYD